MIAKSISILGAKLHPRFQGRDLSSRLPAGQLTQATRRMGWDFGFNSKGGSHAGAI